MVGGSNLNLSSNPTRFMLCLGASVRGKKDELEQKGKIEKYHSTELGCQREQGHDKPSSPNGVILCLVASGKFPDMPSHNHPKKDRKPSRKIPCCD